MIAVICLIPGIGSIRHSAGLPVFSRLLQVALHFFTPVAYGAAAMVAWIFAGGLAAKVTGPADPAVPLAPLTRGDVYGFGLLLGGLWFFLTYLGGSINWLHHLAVSGASADLIQHREGSPIYELSSQLIPCVAGLAVAIRAPQLGRKVAAKTARDPSE